MVNLHDLIAFEERVAAAFNDGQIRSPIHLHYGNEVPLIEIFKTIRSQDWVFSSWRSHYHCLLKGVDQDRLYQAILNGNSIALCFADHRIFSSAIVGGNIPIALGTAMAMKRKAEDADVFCFVGDMTAESGLFHESLKYATNHDLPIKFIVEDNAKSVMTDTFPTWGQESSSFAGCTDSRIVYYRYSNKYPHSGAGVRVQF
jgi:TPP-dependent pyruvate/acetoin dehydrogenase alpha subunit